MSRRLVFAGIELHPDGSVRCGDEWQNTSSCRAYVETGGQISRRPTLTRVGAGALVAGPVGAILGGMFSKKVDQRELYLMIDGDKASWLVPVHPRRSGEARQFANAVNSSARDWAEKEGR